MHILKTFLGATFLAAASLNLVTTALGMRTMIVVSSLMPAISAGDLIESVGAVTVGAVVSFWVRRRAVRQSCG